MSSIFDQATLHSLYNPRWPPHWVLCWGVPLARPPSALEWWDIKDCLLEWSEWSALSLSTSSYNPWFPSAIYMEHCICITSTTTLLLLQVLIQFNFDPCPSYIGQYINHVLLLDGSTFTVGEVEENASVTQLLPSQHSPACLVPATYLVESTPVPKSTPVCNIFKPKSHPVLTSISEPHPVMAATPEPSSKVAATHVPLGILVDYDGMSLSPAPELAPVLALVPESRAKVPATDPNSNPTSSPSSLLVPSSLPQPPEPPLSPLVPARKKNLQASGFLSACSRFETTTPLLLQVLIQFNFDPCPCI